MKFLTEKENERIILIRKNSAKWIRKKPIAKTWDDAFLLHVIDTLFNELSK